jgi:hypothetical protein
LQPSRNEHTPLLDLVYCTIASRHLDVVTQSILTPRLLQVTEDAIFRRIFDPAPSTESIHALLVLALWSPILDVPQSNVRDGRLLVASAVSMAMNLRLSQASTYAIGLREREMKKKMLSPSESRDLTGAMEKARLVG